MLQLPPNLLITDQAGLDTYLARTADPDADPFDYRGIAWLGRDHAVSTSVSARSFRDTRRTPPSAAPRQYIGFGDNAPVTAGMVHASMTRGPDASGATDCNWPLSEWNKPIAATELRQAASLIGARVGTLFGVDRLRIDPLTTGDSVSAARVSVGKRLSRTVYVTYSVDPSSTAQQILEVEWKVSEQVTLVLTQNGDGSYALDTRWGKKF